MDILFVTSHFGAHEQIGFMPLVGTELAQRDHNVCGLQYEDGEVISTIPIDRITTREVYTPYWFGQWLFYKDWFPKVRSYIKETDPDVVVTDRRCMAPTLIAAEKLGIPSIGVVPGLGFKRFNPRNLDKYKVPSFRDSPFSVKIQYPFVRLLFEWHRRAVNDASEIVVISDFLQDVLKKTFDRNSTVVRTPVHLDGVRASSVDPRYLTVVNPRTTLKGSRLTIRLAEQLRGHEFQIAGEFANKKDAQRARELKNVEYLGWVEDMRKVYREANMILAPSLVEEGGGPRVVIEGFANGVPAVGTNRGAIPEHIDDAGCVVSNPTNIDEWSECIDRISNNRDKLSKNACKNAKIYEANKQIDKFEQVLRNIG